MKPEGSLPRPQQPANHVAILSQINPSSSELNPICHLLALLEAHHILHISRIRVNPVHALLSTTSQQIFTVNTIINKGIY
jgi:hypothetical protein